MKVEMMVKDKTIILTDETPFYIMLRDLFYGGEWHNMKKDFPNFLNDIEVLEFIEKNVTILSEAFYGPVIWSELVSFFNEKGIKPESFEHGTVDGLYELAIEYADKDLLGDAKNILEFAIKIDRSFAPAYEFLGTILIEQGNSEEGIKFLNRAIEVDPWLVQAYSTLGEVYYNKGEYEKAINYWLKEIEYSPNDIFTYFMIADAYTRSKNYEKAIEILNKLIEIDSDNVIAMYELSQIYREIGRNEEADIVEKEILNSKPSDPNGIEIWAKIKMKYGKYDEIVKVMEPIIDDSFESLHLKALLIVPYIKLGKIEKAKKYYEELKENDFWYLFGKKEIFDKYLTNKEKQLCGMS
ncbi:tetratricopeptide repeat protein [Thermosipho melanesiensis]|uniref:Tetratricopeptide TPR_2 repeat protein n=2 Tax=Thermosipho melanesiensis TaxID=46541 RepID=A6LNY0_THEM4|nr:tetratricopeptide repeat protein [Thermosipho melanesiensis]ABR31631.1 Tetratricopeptide TPR_2 repeat protein [Thermosipho melanesiensis BI429]